MPDAPDRPPRPSGPPSGTRRPPGRSRPPAGRRPSGRTAAPPPRLGAARRQRRRRPIGWWTIALTIIAVLLVGELVARAIGPDLPKEVGTDEESLIKARDMAALSDRRTDVVFVGASETAAGLIPSKVDAASSSLTGAYNAALRGASPNTDLAWSERVVLPRLHPKLVVIGLLPAQLAIIDGPRAVFKDRSDAAYAAAIDEIDPNRLGRIEQALADHSALIDHRTQLQKPSAVARGIKAALSGDPAEVPAAQDPKALRALIERSGESLEYRSLPEDLRPDPELGGLMNQASASGFDLTDLEHLLRRLRGDHVDVVLAIAPFDRDTMAASGARLAPYDRAVARALALAARLHVPALDRFTDGYPADQFHDKQHLAEAGADRWSGEVGAWLDQLCSQGRLPRACPPKG